MSKDLITTVMLPPPTITAKICIAPATVLHGSASQAEEAQSKLRHKIQRIK